MDSAYEIALVAAALLCGLVSGFLFAFVVVAMPGIGRFGDRVFLQAFREMDLIIQRRHPAFMVMWLGSVVAALAAAGLSSGADADGTWLTFIAAAVWIIGVQLPTFRINIPMNDRVQALDLESLSEAELSAERGAFEPRWNRWNRNRTIAGIASTILLLFALASA